uniref:Scavenger receptor class F member 2 n=1 Tax=Naja naja TaxID=35670 RepID=A0A8C6YBX0_NAJNA
MVPPLLGCLPAISPPNPFFSLLQLTQPLILPQCLSPKLVPVPLGGIGQVSLCCSPCRRTVCEGNFTCTNNEVCVRPNECRCRHGYFGANCETKCPRLFWGPDCKELCNCYPNGQCEDVTGQCTCNANRWGPQCENVCLCKHGKCDQKTGKCSCEPNWWGPQCASACYCSLNSQCDQKTGLCLCQPGWWGRTCNNQCACSTSPCEQFTGRCQCRSRTFGPRCDRYCQCQMGKCNQVDGTCTCEPGYRGKFCREACPAGFYGQGCRRRCGQCKELQPCTIVDGRCLACEAGWNGTKCDQICSSGFYGEGCEQICPPCKDGHTCNHINGKCSHCNPGWIGDRCETKCRNGTYGENCAFVCSSCFNGECHFETGRCLCQAGFHGTFCNLTCPIGHYGANCAELCNCHKDSCNPFTGMCHMEANQRMGVIGAGVLLIFLLCLLLLFCCCICRKKDQARDIRQDLARKKSSRRLCGQFSQISLKLPRIPLRRQKLPKVVVAHHDLENTLNCSFIEPPSVVDQPSPSWSSRGSFSSFDTTDEGPVYCVPHEGHPEEDHDPLLPRTPCSPGPADSGEAPLLKSSDSERSSCGSGSVSGALYDAPVAEPRPAKPPSPERAKPPPPDPSTKPKVSWIHHKYNAAQSNSLPTAAELQAERRPGPSKRKRSPGEAARAKERAPKPPQEPGSPEGPHYPAQTRQRSRTGPEPPKAPPGFSSEAATLLAAQLKEKTQSLQRGEAGARPNGMSPLPAQREKPAPPQKAKQAGAAPAGQKAGKPLLPTSAPLQKLLGPDAAAEPKSGEKQTAAGGSPEPTPAPGEPAPKKTPIKKPPRKKGREGAAEPPKGAATPPQTVQ